MHNNRRVVVTGLSVVSPLGNTIEELTRNIFAGKSGINWLEAEFTAQLTCKVAAQVKFNPVDYFNKKSDYAILDRNGQMALHASIDAVKHSQLDFTDELKSRAGVYVGTGMRIALSVEDGYKRCTKKVKID